MNERLGWRHSTHDRWICRIAFGHEQMTLIIYFRLITLGWPNYCRRKAHESDPDRNATLPLRHIIRQRKLNTHWRIPKLPKGGQRRLRILSLAAKRPPWPRGPHLRLGGLGERLSSPSGSGRSPAAKRFGCMCGLKMTSVRTLNSGASRQTCIFT